MVILFLAPANNYHTHKWATFFVTRGYEVHVVSLISGQIKGVKVHVINTATTVNDSDLKKLFYLTKGSLVRKIVSSIKPDIISVHYATSYGTLAALSGINRYSLSVWGTDIYSFPLKSIFHKLLLKFSLKSASLLLSTSKAMASEAAKYTTKKFIVTPFGVDVNQFTPIKRTRQDNLFVFGTVKALSPEYGIDLIIEAASEIKRTRPDIQFQVRIAGKGPSESQYRQLAIKKGVEQEVRWLGFISQEQAAIEWANLDVAVIPSYRESFGVSALEAQSSSIPLIISDVDGLKEATIPGKTCIVVRIGNVKQITDSLIRMYDNKKFAKSMGKAGREFVQSTFEYEACFRRIEDILVSKLCKREQLE